MRQGSMIMREWIFALVIVWQLGSSSFASPAQVHAERKDNLPPASAGDPQTANSGLDAGGADRSTAEAGIKGRAVYRIATGAPPAVPVPPQPLAGIAIVFKDQFGDEVCRQKTDKSGLFKVALAPGRYKVQAEWSVYKYSQPVTVKEDQVLNLNDIYLLYCGPPIP